MDEPFGVTRSSKPSESCESAAIDSSPRKPARTFLVGCPRSGTTFLQAALASHPRVLSLPETAFLERILPGRVQQVVAGYRDDAPNGAHQRARAFLRFRRRAQRHLRRFADGLGIALSVRDTHVALGGFVGAFADLLDRTAEARDCEAWIEKTPNHVFYLDVLERHVPRARFIHLLRNGEDVLASIVDASMRHGGLGEHRPFSQGIPWWVAYWNAAVAAHRARADDDNHCIVFYEDLINDFDRQYERLCRFMGIEALAPTLDSANDVADLCEEPWKRDALCGHLRPAVRKFDAVFGPDTQGWIRQHLVPYDEIHATLSERII